MSEIGSISQLLALARHGDSVATTAVVGRYFERLSEAAQTMLRRRHAPRRIADEEDVANSALNSVLMRIRQGQYPDLIDRDSFWGLLLKVAERKSANLARDQWRRKRGGGSVRGDEIFGSPDESHRRSLDDFPAANLFCEEALVLEETMATLLDAVKDDAKLQRIATMLLHGYKMHEIRSALGIPKSTLGRKVKRLRAALLGQRQESLGEAAS